MGGQIIVKELTSDCFPIDGGGAVFAGSSIVYGGAMAWNDFDNDLAVVTTRVLDSFCGDLPH